MNENVTKLIEQLAYKLGTTSEYLWSVMIKQAPIDASVSLVQIIVIWFAWYPLFRAHKYLSDDDNDFSYYHNDGNAVVMGVALVLMGVLSLVSFAMIGDVITGFFNPEYWAIEKIINAISKK